MSLLVQGDKEYLRESMAAGFLGRRPPWDAEPSGRVGTDGSVRIELPATLAPSEAPVDIVVESVPAALADVVARGAVVGHVSLHP